MNEWGGHTWRLSAAALLAVGLAFAIARPAQAQASVHVQVRTAAGKVADGKVILQGHADGHRYTCTTAAGACRIDGVPGGSYEVRLEPKKGHAPPPRKVMIPPSGEVTLIVSTGD